MRKLLNTVIESLPALLNILLLMTFFFIILSILSISLWKGTHHQFCRITPVPIDGLWPVNDNIQSLCGGDFNCPGNNWCGTNFIDSEDNILWKVDDLWRRRIIWFNNVIVGYKGREV